MSCQFIWFVALLIALTAGSGVLAYLILGSDLIKPDLICMLACVSSFSFSASILSLDLLLPNANASELCWAGRVCKQLSTVGLSAQAAGPRLVIA